MKATVNPVDQHVVTLTIEVPAAEVDKGIKQAVKRIAGQVLSLIHISEPTRPY